MELWFIWLIIAVVLGVAEIFTTTPRSACSAAPR